MNSASVPQIYYILRQSTMESLSFSRIHYLFRNSTRYWLSVSGIHYLLRLYTMNSLFFRDSTINSFYFSRIYYLFRKYFKHRLNFFSQQALFPFCSLFATLSRRICILPWDYLSATLSLIGQNFNSKNGENE